MMSKTKVTKSFSSSAISDILPDFAPGPLDLFRNQSSFKWRDMALIMEAEELLRFKHGIWKQIENDPLFHPSPVELSFQEKRVVTLERAFRVTEFIPKGFYPRGNAEVSSVLGHYDWSLALRRANLLSFFTNAIRGLGTEKHYKYIDAADKHQLTACVAMTEISHGTNVRGLQTTCTFDKIKNKLILHTPNFESAKCWAGNMAKTANFAYVLAQLYTPDGECHGLHGFVVPIRDNQLNTFPGVTIGDMGEKLGLNGLDNGFMMFDNYEIHLDCLLDKNCSIASDGKYITPLKDPMKRFGASVGNLSGPRIGIVSLSSVNMINAVTIAIRYAAVRKQFAAPGGNEELAVIEYQMQQWRLFPYLAATYVIRFFSNYCYDILIEFAMSQYNLDVSPDSRAVMGIEIHAISSAAKPIAGWLARDAVQECREACGGHGYLRSAGIGRLRNDGDAFMTFEGDNNVLLQQTSNWLLNIWSNPKRENIIKDSPLGALTFLRNVSSRLKKKFDTRSSKNDIMTPTFVLKTYKCLVCWLLQSTNEKYQEIKNAHNGDTFIARNDSQIYHASTLSIAFIEHYMLEMFFTKLVTKPEIPDEIRDVLTRLMILFGLWSLDKHLGTLYQSGYFSGPKPARFIREAILDLCKSLKGDAVALIDAIAPSDFILNSVLGNSDGQVYENLERAMKQTPGCFERASDWSDIASRLTAKL